MSALTIVMVGSNEDYGGDFIARVQRCLDSIFAGINTYGLDADLIFVDWGTPPERRPMIDSIGWSKCSIPARVITVPKPFIEQIPNPYGIKFLEPWAKSVGVRRATGAFILTANADGIYSDPLMACLSRTKLDSQCVYRVNRYDQDEKGSVYRVQRANGTFAPGEPYAGFSRTAAPWKTNMPHFNAAGEFMLMSREAYHAIKGWPELPYWAHVDSMVLHRALEYGLKQVVFEEPLYHQDHTRGNHPFMPTWTDDKPWSVENTDDWGFRGVEFDSCTIAIKRTIA